MKQQQLFSSFIVFLLLIGVNGDLVSDTCKKIADEVIPYDFCVASLVSDPGSHTADLYELNLIAMKLGKDKITSIQSYIQTLLKTKKWDNLMRVCFKTCMDMFDTGKSEMVDAIDQFSVKSYKGAESSLTSAGGCGDSCEENFTEFEGLVSPLTKMNGDCGVLIDIALKITQLFLTNQTVLQV